MGDPHSKKGLGELEKEVRMPGVTRAMCGEPATAQRPGPRQDRITEANSFIPDAHTGELLKNPRHLLGSLKLFPASNHGDHPFLFAPQASEPCLLSL